MDNELITFSAKNTEKCPIRETDIRAKELQSKDSKLSYRDAVHSVFSVDEDLHRAYLAECPPVHQGGA